MTFDINGYTDVATRLDMAFHKFPELRIQETHREIVGVKEGVNDPDDIKTFDYTYCDECGGKCDIVAEDEYNRNEEF